MKKILLFATVLVLLCIGSVVAQATGTTEASVGVFDFIKANWALIASALFAVSEVLALIPKIKANGIFQFIFNALSKAKK